MLHVRKTLLTAAAAMCLTACSSGGTHAPEGTLGILEAAVESGRFLYAHQDDLCYGHTWTHPSDIEGDSIERSDVFSVCGDYPAIVGFDLGGIELGNSRNLDGVDFRFMRRAAMEHIARGGIVTFSWHPRNPLTGGDTWDVSSDHVVASIIEGGENEAEFGLWLDRVAGFLSSIKNPDGSQAQVIFRPWHEHMGGWFWWGADLCTKEEYIALWNRTFDCINGKFGLNDVIWAYSPNADVDKDGYMERYPGDSIIDLMGMDLYQYSDSRSYIRQMKNRLGYLTELGQEHGKTIIVSETGYEGIRDAEWWTKTLYEAVRDFPVAYVLTWRNAWDRPEHFFGPYPEADCEEDFRAFHSLDKTIFLKDLK